MKDLKKIIFLLVSVILFSNLQANSTKESELLESFKKYIGFLHDENPTKMVEFIYEPVFQTISKKEMIDIYESGYKSGRVPKIIKVEKIDVDPVEKYTKGYFTAIHYNVYMNISFPSRKKKDIERFEEILKSSLGEGDTLKYDKEKRVFMIKRATEIVSINENEKGWKFLELNNLQQLKEQNIISNEILDGLQK